MNLVEEFLNRVKDRLIEDYDRKGLRASGLTANLLKVEKVGDRWVLKTPDYFIFEILGRGPGGLPPLEAIRDWVTSKGIEQKSIYPIAKKIADEGTRIFKGEVEGIDFQGIFDDEMKIFIREFADQQSKEIADAVVNTMLKVSTRG